MSSKEGNDCCNEDEIFNMVRDLFGEVPIGNISIKEIPIPEELRGIISGKASVLKIPMTRGLGDLLKEMANRDLKDLDDKTYGEILTTYNVEVVGYAPEEVSVSYIRTGETSYFEVYTRSGNRTGKQRIDSGFLLTEFEVDNNISTEVAHGLLKIHIHEKREAQESFSVKIR